MIMVDVKDVAGVRAAVDSAMAELVSVKHGDGISYVHLPIFYPSGAAVTVSVEQIKGGYLVTDEGFAYREIEMVGADRMFGRAARNAGERFGVDANPRMLSANADTDTLASAIADIAIASAWVSHSVVDRISDRDVNEIAQHLYGRLVDIFGVEKVEQKASIVGASSNDWEVSSLVHLDGRIAVFDVVRNHHTAVYSTSTKFHDLALLSSPPVTVAVVKDKKAMGAYYGILAQAGHVIQDHESDAVIRRATAA
jgi:hypothetical protein